MKNLLFILTLLVSVNTFADGHVKPADGAFTTLNVAAKDIDKYVGFLKSNSDAFKAIGSSDAGVCVTRSGNDYPGELMVWNAFPSVEAAMTGSLKYDPYKAGGQITKLRELKHSAIWKSLKSFRLEPGHEVVARVKVKQDHMDEYMQLNEEFPIYEGQKMSRLVKTGDNTFCYVGIWESEDAIAAQRDAMIEGLDKMRHTLEEISPDLGVTDPVSGPVVIAK